MNIVLFGAPGAGKGTQSALLVEKCEMFHISTGDLFREAIKNESALGVKAKSFMDQGKLVPDDVVVGMVEEVFEKVGDKDFILDGFPRTAAQAEALESMLSRHSKKIDRAVFLSVPSDLLLKRLTGRRLCKECGAVYHIQTKKPQKEGVCDLCQSSSLYQREDDREEVISTRLQAYENSTAPLVKYYKDKGQYVEIDGVGPSEEVFAQVKSVLVE